MDSRREDRLRSKREYASRKYQADKEAREREARKLTQLRMLRDHYDRWGRLDTSQLRKEGARVALRLLKDKIEEKGDVFRSMVLLPRCSPFAETPTMDHIWTYAKKNRKSIKLIDALECESHSVDKKWTIEGAKVQFESQSTKYSDMIQSIPGIVNMIATNSCESLHKQLGPSVPPGLDLCDTPYGLVFVTTPAGTVTEPYTNFYFFHKIAYLVSGRTLRLTWDPTPSNLEWMGNNSRTLATSLPLDFLIGTLEGLEISDINAGDSFIVPPCKIQAILSYEAAAILVFRALKKPTEDLLEETRRAVEYAKKMADQLESKAEIENAVFEAHQMEEILKECSGLTRQQKRWLRQAIKLIDDELQHLRDPE